ncbi:MAG: Hsp20/alpha crystallin family protein [Burkholderiaceae bacterium]|nr:Hsp20/alpha crystallin family protein [Burkholderiaceae bacterium]
MTDKQEVATRASTEPQAGREDRARQDDMTLAPAVDIFEDAGGITLQAEMPGVSKERLEVRADRNGLLIEGQASIDLPAGMEALYADVQATRYRRGFTLSSELDTDRIEASMKDGVLTLYIPKRAEFRPRRIEVQSA